MSFVLHSFSASPCPCLPTPLAQKGISPSLADSLLLAIAFQGQRTNEPKSEDAPNNVFAPIEGYDRVEGDFRNLSIPSFLDSLDMNPPLKWGALAFAALGIAALLGIWDRNDI